MSSTNPIDKIVFIQKICQFVPFQSLDTTTTTVDDVDADRSDYYHQNNNIAFETLPVKFASVCQSWREAMIEYDTASMIWRNLNTFKMQKTQNPVSGPPTSDVERSDDDSDYSTSDGDDDSYDDEDYVTTRRENEQKLAQEKLKHPEDFPDFACNVLLVRCTDYFHRRITALRNQVRKFDNSNITIQRHKHPDYIPLPSMADLSWVVQQLLRAGANPLGSVKQSVFNRNFDPDFSSPVMVCCRQGNLEVLKVLLEEGPLFKQEATIDELLYTDASKYDSHEKTNGYNSQKYDVRSQTHPLFVAIDHQHRHIVKYLVETFNETIKKSINFTLRDRETNGGTCLNRMILNHDLELVQLLIEKCGANVNQISMAPRTQYGGNYTISKKGDPRYCPKTPVLMCFVVQPMNSHEKIKNKNDTNNNNNYFYTCTSFTSVYLGHEKYEEAKCCRGIEIFDLLVRKYGAHPDGLETPIRNSSLLIDHEVTSKYRNLLGTRFFGKDDDDNQQKDIHRWVYVTSTLLFVCQNLKKSQTRDSKGKLIKTSPEEDWNSGEKAKLEETNPANKLTVETIKQLIEDYSYYSSSDSDNDVASVGIDTRAVIATKDNEIKNCLMEAIAAENYEVVKYFLEDEKLKETKKIEVSFCDFRGNTAVDFSILNQDTRIANMVGRVLRR